MTPIVKQDVINAASDVATGVSDELWVDVLNYVNQFTLSCVDSDYDRRLARIYLAAHILSYGKQAASEGSSGKAGPVISESVGGVRRSYGFVATASAALSNTQATKYGKTYDLIIGASGAAGPMLV